VQVERMEVIRKIKASIFSAVFPSAVARPCFFWRKKGGDCAKINSINSVSHL